MTENRKIAKSFVAVKTDMQSFRQSMNDWIVFLDHSQRDTRTQLRELERKVKQLEAKLERERFMLG